MLSYMQGGGACLVKSEVLCKRNLWIELQVGKINLATSNRQNYGGSSEKATFIIYFARYELDFVLVYGRSNSSGC